MSDLQEPSGRRFAAFHTVHLFLFLAVCIACGVHSPAQETPDRMETLELLEKRQKRQLETRGTFAAFHRFSMIDRWAESGLNFEHRIVADAGKTWKPAHYDHGGGVAVADVDADGLLDIYFPTQLGTSQLWRNTGGGRFENITPRAGVGLTDQLCVGASFADVDNDGDPDLFVTTVRNGNHLFENVGQGRFKDITATAGVGHEGHSSGAVFFDYDKDGLLDLFLCNVGVYTHPAKGPDGQYAAITNAFHGHMFPERTEYKILYKNLGHRKFKDVTAEAGLRDGSWSGDASFCDLNEDGWPDLYLVNMQGDDHYYENQGGKKFVERTAEYFPKTPWGAMGLKFFDYNHDGRMDLFITDMHSDMSPAQTLEGLNNFAVWFEKQKSEQYCTTRWDESFLQGATNNYFGNVFFEKQASRKFVERSDALNLETYWPWGPSVGDLNADGYEDIFVTAGMGYPFRYGVNSVLLNDGGQRFHDVEFILGIEPRAEGRIEKTYFVLQCDGVDREHPLCSGQSGATPVRGPMSSRSSAIFDLDEDGDLDIVTAEMNDRPQVLISDLSKQKPVRYLQIKLAGSKSNRDGLGAVVKVHVGKQVMTQVHDGKSGFLSQSSMPLYFGLGAAAQVDRIEILWPSGIRQEIAGPIPGNRQMVVTEAGQNSKTE
ncbi:MAG: CRTAC1 family protein [Verrucomicrobiota bacterium]